MCSGGCGGSTQKMSIGTPGYTGKLHKPSAMVSKTSTAFTFGPYGARKASEVIGRTKMPPVPKPRR